MHKLFFSRWSRTLTKGDDEHETQKVEGFEYIFGDADIVDHAIQWARSCWTGDMPPIQAININPGLQFNCPSLLRFLNGTKLHNVQLTDPNNYFFAWHGTPSKSNVKSICDMGFNPACRKRGSAEYFAFSPSFSKQYCGSCNFIIVSLIVKGTWLVSQPQSYCYVQNPTDFNHSYVLPLLVINFGLPDEIGFNVYK